MTPGTPQNTRSYTHERVFADCRRTEFLRNRDNETEKKSKKYFYKIAGNRRWKERSSTFGFFVLQNHHPHVALIQPGHDTILRSLHAGSGDAALAYVGPAVGPTGPIIQNHQLAQETHSGPLRALGSGDVGLGRVIIRVQFLNPFPASGYNFNGLHFAVFVWKFHSLSGKIPPLINSTL